MPPSRRAPFLRRTTTASSTRASELHRHEVDASIGRRRDWWAGAGAALLAAAIYFPTVLRSYGFIDKGEMAAAAATLGIPHPTGYPALTLLGHVATLLSPARPVYTLNVLAALLAAGGVGLMVMLFGRLVGSSRLAAVAAVITGLTTLWWSQATGFEAYALHALFLPLLCVLFLRFVDRLGQPDKAAWPRGAVFAFVLGLSFTNHSSTIMLAPAFLFLYARAAGLRPESLRRLLTLAPPFLLGLTPYLWMYLRAKQQPALNWGDPSTLPRLWQHISGAQFQYTLFLEKRVFAQQTLYFWNTLVGDSAWVGLVLAAAGAVYAFRTKRDVAVWALLLFLGCVVAAGLHDINEIQPYYLLAYVSYGAFLAWGLVWASSRFGTRLTIVAGAGLALFNGVRHFSPMDESGNYMVEDLTQNMIGGLPANAVVISNHWDYWTAGALYAQEVDGLRKDVVLLDVELLRSAWYLDQLTRRHPQLMEAAGESVQSFQTWIQKLERNPRLPPAEVDAYWNGYFGMIRRIIEGNFDRRPFFVTEGVDQRIGVGLERLPVGLAAQLSRTRPAALPPMPELRYRPWSKRVDPYSIKIAELYTMAFLGRARYEESMGRPTEARRYGLQALTFDPGFRPGDVPDFPLHIDDQIREVLRNYEHLRRRATASAPP
jgi:hypothetical protein